jgi:DNA-binding response OmpR family regulator
VTAPRVLLVEDDWLIRSAVADGLREDGFEVLEAETGDEAISLIEGAATSFDLLCTDVRMPGRADGIDVAVRARGRSPRVPVLVVSGYASELSRRLGAFNPPAVFIQKPFTLADVSRTLRVLLDRS